MKRRPRTTGNRMIAIASVAATGLLPASAAVITIDNSDSGYSETGSWNTWGSEGQQGTNYRYSNSPATSTATWTASGIAAGRYLLSASYTPGGTRPTAVSYAVNNGIGTLGPVSQLTATYADFSREPTAGSDSVLYYTRLSNTAFEINGGSLTATVSAPSGTLIADAFRLESVRSDVLGVYVIDSENPAYNNGTFSVTGGSFASWSGDLNDHRQSIQYATADGAAASYAFGGLPDGTYRVSATWTPGGARPANARYFVDGGPTIDIDQTISPSDDYFEDVAWDDLFTVNVTGGSLTVKLQDPLGGGNTLIADSVRLERLVVPEPGTPAILASVLVAGSLRRRRK
ncbi:MAG: PEP-CTERM sorting domain-containing protein [Verrucomicrobia bacterium]|nr:PEP-CTERM sorting domain-containing protein [Verrucomicrobiota bacterium]